MTAEWTSFCSAHGARRSRDDARPTSDGARRTKMVRAPAHMVRAAAQPPPAGWQFAEMIVRPACCCFTREAEPRVKLRNRRYGLWSAKSVVEFRGTKNPCVSGRFEFIYITED
jgi:hypothetical protein